MTVLSGSVTVEGKPSVDAVVELRNSSGDIVDQVQVDDGGRYTYHLIAGQWSLRAWNCTGFRGKADVKLEGGEDKVVDLPLEPEGGTT